MRGLGYGTRAASQSGPTYDPLTAITWQHAGWADDPLWANPGNGNPVSSWRNSSGAGDPANTGSNRPTFRTNVGAYNNKSTVEFAQASSQFLEIPMNVGTQRTVVIIGNLNPASGSQRFMGLGTGSNLRGLGANATPWYINAGAALTGTNRDSDPHLLQGRYHGTLGYIYVDGTQVATGNSGTVGMTYISLGAGNNAGATASYLDGNIAFWGVYNGSFVADVGYTDFKAWVASYYGLTIA